jgi:asparagine synthase (glutamine-hydrolysing)
MFRGSQTSMVFVMCGVAGFLQMTENVGIAEQAPLLLIRDHMRSRGPDGEGIWISAGARIGLAHRRLSIIDLSERGAQPMHQGDLSITFNGEIYNYQALRRDLEAQGEHFVSDSDTEVLLKLYARHGTAMFQHLRGMYAFAIWDGRSQELLLGRDPFGIKPLYYAQQDGQFWFASQCRALVDTGVINAQPDTRAWTQFLLWGSVPEPRTAYEAVRAVPAGCWLKISSDKGVGEPVRHFDMNATYAAQSDRSSAEDVRAAVLDSVRHHLIADVPVGIFLSAGIDSAAVLGLAHDAGVRSESVTLGFTEFTGSARDETPLAAELALRYHSRHHIRRVDRSEFEADLPSILAAMDQPSIDGINSWFVAKAAKELGWKVALSGLGGDELFGGYPSFRDLPRWTAWLAWARHVPRLGEYAGRLIGRLASHPKAQGLLRYGGTWSGAYFLRRGLFMPWEIEAERPSWLPQDRDAIVESLQSLESLLIPDPASNHARVSVLETAAYMRNQLLRDSDWASMAHSIELRVPLVDSELSRRLAPHMPAAVAGVAKAALALAPTKPLPEFLINRPKTGFETPVGEWIKTAATKSGEPWARNWARTICAEVPCQKPQVAA